MFTTNKQFNHYKTVFVIIQYHLIGSFEILEHIYYGY